MGGRRQSDAGDSDRVRSVSPWDIEPEQAAAMAIECETAGLAVDGKLTNSDGAQINSQQALRVYGNSNGFLGPTPARVTA